MFRKKHSLIKGTLILTSAGLVSRVLGFFFRIFLSHTFGEEQVGLYQLIFPFYALCLSLSTSGLETAISRSVSRFHSLGRTQDGKLIFQTGLILSVLISLICTLLVHPLGGKLLKERTGRDLAVLVAQYPLFISLISVFIT